MGLGISNIRASKIRRLNEMSIFRIRCLILNTSVIYERKTDTLLKKNIAIDRLT